MQIMAQNDELVRFEWIRFDFVMARLMGGF